MDPIGASASLLTLIDAALKTFKHIKSLVNGYQNALVEIKDLGHRLDGLDSNLRLLRYVQVAVSNDEGGLRLDTTDFEVLQRSLMATSVTFLEISTFLTRITRRNGRTVRLRWTLYDAKKVKSWEDRLQLHGDILQRTLLLLNNRHMGNFEAEFKDFKQILLNLQAHQPNNQPLKSMERFSWAKSVFGSNWALPYIASVNGSVCCSENSTNLRSYGISVRLHALFCLKVFSVEARFKLVSLFSVEVSAIATGVVLKNVVPEDSLIMTACQAGNTFVVWNLLNEGKASVNDVTPDNFSPFSYAIASGSVELLEQLVWRGADPRKSFGRFQTSPLDWAFAHRQPLVARWLLRNRVDAHQISARGWTAPFSLFGDEPEHQAPCEEYLEIISAASFSDFDAQDGDGWTAMHRAAAFGNANQIRSLIARGASPKIQTRNLMWTPIFCAVQFNNMSTFEELTRHQPNFLTATDVRKWTLLHLAVESKRLNIMRLLIDLGADPRACSFPTCFFIPDDLNGLSLLPGDIARIRGTHILSTYLDALAVKGHDVQAVDDEQDNLLDLFWPAEEHIVEIE
ncbi:ankyrin repeat-containing domain protein [Tricladium varicosporioides]|nr:ankyrin repeat-containing domain protein [Hymenoscyphus varicosporioides]